MMTAANSQPRTKEADKGQAPTVSSLELLAGRKQLIIQHGREQYRLLLTNSNKLILTK
jgi:hemin uptake protein HemP